MAKLHSVSDLVYAILKADEETRADDFKLILRVLSAYIEDNSSLNEVMLHHAELGIPSLATITRVRRKIQELYPELAVTKMKQVRAKEEERYIEYSREKNNYYLIKGNEVIDLGPEAHFAFMRTKHGDIVEIQSIELLRVVISEWALKSFKDGAIEVLKLWDENGKIIWKKRWNMMRMFKRKGETRIWFIGVNVVNILQKTRLR